MARFGPASLVLAAALALGAAACGNGPVSPYVVASRTLTTDGGRVDWCAANNRIAFDRVTSLSPLATEVYSILPDGSDERCVTCTAPSLPTGIRGQPAWHPSCAFLVIQVQGSFYSGNRFQFVSWGIDNDLWVVAADGSWAERIVQLQTACQASLHPQFSDTGGRLFWAVREPTGVTITRDPLDPTPCEENPWDGWHLAVATFTRTPLRPAALSARVDLYPTDGGFFESHALVGNTIWFSHSPAGLPYVDDSYTAAADGTGRANITRSTPTWDEHAQPSPGGRAFAFNSSRSFRWAHPPDLADTLRLELWATLDGGAPVRLTKLNSSSALSRTRVLTSDFAWGPSGQEIVLYHADVSGSGTTQVIEILTLDQAY